MTEKAATTPGVMTRRAALALALASALPLTIGTGMRRAAAEPAPDTWMHAGNAARTGAFPGPGLDLSQEVVELWRIDGNQTGIIVEPCGVCDGMAYYISIWNGISPEPVPLIAVETQTGNEVWRHEPPVTEPATSFWGKPAIANGLLVMPTRGNLLVGFDARSGEQRWVFDLQGMCTDSRPAIVDDVLYVSDTSSVNAIKLGDAPEWLWKASLGDGATTVVSGTVSVDGDYVVAASLSPAEGAEGEKQGTTIHALKAGDGAEDFRFQFRTEGETHQIAVQDGMLYSRVDNTFMERSYFFSTTIDGEEGWLSRTSLGAEPAYPAVDGDLVYIPGGDRVWAYDAATGETVWSSPPVQALDTGLALIDGVIYIGAAPPTPMLYALSAADGTLLSSIPVPYNGAQVIGITNEVLIARSGIHLVALANLP